MKKLLYLALALMIAVGLCACFERATTGANTETTAPTEGETTAPVEDETTAPVEEETTAPIENATTAPEPTGPEPTEHIHDYQETVVIKATCTETGMMFLKCTTCGDCDYKEISAPGHNEAVDAAVAATCTETGLTEGKHCSVCNEVLVAQESILPCHNYDEQQICKDCAEHKYLTFALNDDGVSYYVAYCGKKGGIVFLVDTVVIPDTYKGLPVTSIGDYVFSNCPSLTSIEIPDSVTYIDSFSGCSNLMSIVIPDSVTYIGGFSGCSSLTSIVIPNSVTSIGDSAFSGCSSLTDITFDGTMEQWGAIHKFSYWDLNTGSYVIHCTDGDISK